ncbi:hypothetical protein HOF78_03895 [Candidatus Woesearchaeota archaeon]|jgi:hypothetical protein|nr:hypothetical protein [Candidatus Woesearchaeota archaeon]MBT6044714.1 hypothetical protein [Candidatus Woesearchaeota archaeon]
MIKSKKGNTHLLFKWIFGVIAGAIILAFFIKFSYVHLSGESLIEGNRILLTVDNKLDAFGVKEGTDVFDLKGEFNLGFDCGVLSSGTPESNNFFERKTDKIIFTQPKINERYFSVWTKKWEAPYGVSTFYYLKDKNSVILFVGPSSSSEDFVNFVGRIPSNMGIQAVDTTQFNPGDFVSTARQSSKFTVVYFGNPTYDWSTLKSQYGNFGDLEVVVVNLNEHIAEVYDTYGNKEDVFYFGDEMLYGLIFSGSKFSCTKEIAMNRFNLLTRIHLEKVGRIMSKENRPVCVDLLNEARKMLENYQFALTKTELYDLLEKVGRQNLQLEREDCPTVY